MWYELTFKRIVQNLIGGLVFQKDISQGTSTVWSYYNGTMRENPNPNVEVFFPIHAMEKSLFPMEKSQFKAFKKKQIQIPNLPLQDPSKIDYIKRACQFQKV